MGIRVVLVDDNDLMLAGLRQLLMGAPDIEVVGEGGDGQSAVALARSLFPDVIVMDVVMPDMHGIEATRRIRAEDDHVRVIAVSAHTDKPYVENMLRADACGFVLKRAAHNELVRAVRGARLDRIYSSPQISGSYVRGSMNFDPLDEVSA